MGRLDPFQLHEHLASDKSFKDCIFDFVENIIHHHLSQDDRINIDPSFGPRIEQPSHLLHLTQDLLDELYTWESAFVTPIKICGEALQHHVCRLVCHKYGNNNCCKFLFPHKIIEASLII